MKFLIIFICTFGLLNFAYSKDEKASSVKSEVIDIINFCDALNPRFMSNCMYHDIVSLKESLEIDAFRYSEIEWLDNLLECYQRKRFSPRLNIRRSSGRLDIAAEKRISCVINKVNKK